MGALPMKYLGCLRGSKKESTFLEGSSGKKARKLESITGFNGRKFVPQKIREA
uniref:Uncharacterized protein n=2 Tax=Oryza sativa subsp. japonica TaxID=39947 RepID=Q53KR2_ORYSJ|nr:hypothetical protein LOC_Os11g15730 [Oryza sativa Japonica Group]ABA92477.1 hypothetical protein LOC_Os11g15730 [Oryza sativa Japonica Group]